MNHELPRIALDAALELDNTILQRTESREAIETFCRELQELIRDELFSIDLLFRFLKEHPELGGETLTMVEDVLARSREFHDRLLHPIDLSTDEGKTEAEVLRAACNAFSRKASLLESEYLGKRYLAAA